MVESKWTVADSKTFADKIIDSIEFKKALLPIIRQEVKQNVEDSSYIEGLYDDVYNFDDGLNDNEDNDEDLTNITKEVDRVTEEVVYFILSRLCIKD